MRTPPASSTRRSRPSGSTTPNRVAEMRGHLASIAGWSGLAKWRTEWAQPDETRPVVTPTEIVAVRAMLEAAVADSVGAGSGSERRSPADDATPNDAARHLTARVNTVMEQLGLADGSAIRPEITALLGAISDAERSSVWLAASEANLDQRLLAMLDQPNGERDASTARCTTRLLHRRPIRRTAAAPGGRRARRDDRLRRVLRRPDAGAPGRLGPGRGPLPRARRAGRRRHRNAASRRGRRPRTPAPPQADGRRCPTRPRRDETRRRRIVRGRRNARMAARADRCGPHLPVTSTSSSATGHDDDPVRRRSARRTARVLRRVGAEHDGADPGLRAAGCPLRPHRARPRTTPMPPRSSAVRVRAPRARAMPEQLRHCSIRPTFVSD